MLPQVYIAFIIIFVRTKAPQIPHVYNSCLLVNFQVQKIIRFFSSQPPLDYANSETLSTSDSGRGPSLYEDFDHVGTNGRPYKPSEQFHKYQAEPDIIMISENPCDIVKNNGYLHKKKPLKTFGGIRAETLPPQFSRPRDNALPVSETPYSRCNGSSSLAKPKNKDQKPAKSVAFAADCKEPPSADDSTSTMSGSYVIDQLEHVIADDVTYAQTTV